jgi:DNA-binding NarL/FixJ family response regulator
MTGIGLGARRLLVVDVSGEIFDRVRATMPDLSVSWVREVAKLHGQREVALAVLATYGGIEWLAASHLQRQFRTVVVAARYDTAAAAKALELGLAGFLDARLSAATLGRALLGVLGGEPAYPRAVLGRWIETQQRTEPSSALVCLTVRQREILALVAQGAADKQIASVLGISTATVQKHVAHVLTRLGVPNRAAAAVARSAALVG